MPRVPFPKALWRLTILAVLAGFAALVVGCRNTDDVEGPQVLSTLPQSWTPLLSGGTGLPGRGGSVAWRQINIDTDLIPEYLLYFSYDNGQVGAIIYDRQTGGVEADGSTPLAGPNQPAGQYVSYQVEPSFWMRNEVSDTVGFIAPPNTPVDKLRIEQVQRYPAGTAGQAGTANPNPGEDVPPTNELIIYGGSSVVSVLWWRNTTNGYGIAQMQASELRPTLRTQADVLRPLEQVIGLTPQSGLLARSVLCREARFTREDVNKPADAGQSSYQSAVYYGESDGGIVFCTTAPAFPHYPEGVVLAYLRSAPAGATEAIAPPSQLLWSHLSEPQRTALAALVDLDVPGMVTSPPLIVRDLRARPNLPPPPNTSSVSGSLTTNVCAEVETEDGLVHRRLLFDLVYESVQTIGATIIPERFSIANITDITNVFVNCSLIIP